MVEFPKPSNKLAGAKILILNTKGADWIVKGKTYLVQAGKSGKLLIDNSWWACANNEKYFQFIEAGPRPKKPKPGELVMEAKVGDFVVRGRDWDWGNQDEGSAYGQVIHVADGWASVRWFSPEGEPLRSDGYRVGQQQKYDLNYYKV
jgi:hypothetical protein